MWRKQVEEAARHLHTDSTHDWEHVLRVLKTAKKITREEEGDAEVVEAACLLHDCGYAEDWEQHEKTSAKKTREILKQTSFPEEKISLVVSCIESHRFSVKGTDDSLEAKVLRDADKLDAIGAVGIARCFLWTGEHKTTFQIAVRHFHEKLLKVKDSMQTKAGKKIAGERHEFMKKFLEELKKEVGE
ncbi:HD domain-containing protein [Candidatus Micrarchaeota archaeon]|nr:HD domain-containing protein [Candidatus Micrarchaeota archaeon]